MKECNKNPFYDNHLFTNFDLDRCTFSKWHRLWLWLYPTKVQISDGYAWYFKVVNGSYWLIKEEKLK
jgi:hypothetical protein